MNTVSMYLRDIFIYCISDVNDAPCIINHAETEYYGAMSQLRK